MQNNTQSEKEFYQRLEDKLNENTKFPSEYLFKFIIENNVEKEKQLREVFFKTPSEIVVKPSSSGKYNSFSIRIKALSAQQIISLYQQAGKVQGIVSL